MGILIKGRIEGPKMGFCYSQDRQGAQRQAELWRGQLKRETRRSNRGTVTQGPGHRNHEPTLAR